MAGKPDSSIQEVEYTLALLLNAQITGGSGYQYKFVTNKTTFDIVIKLLEYLQKGVDAVKNALSTIFIGQILLPVGAVEILLLQEI